VIWRNEIGEIEGDGRNVTALPRGARSIPPMVDRIGAMPKD
jgi:hypothetical protein